MSKVLVLLANGFEDIEMVVCVDIWRRGKVEVDLASIDLAEVKSGLGTRFIAETHIDNVNPDKYDLLFLPGGGGVKLLDDSDKVKSLITTFMEKEKYISAICAAPLILGKMGILSNRVFTCYPSFEKFGEDGVYKPVGVIQDGNIITGRGVGYAFEFAFYILELLEGKEARESVEEGTLVLESKKGLE